MCAALKARGAASGASYRLTTPPRAEWVTLLEASEPDERAGAVQPHPHPPWGCGWGVVLKSAEPDEAD